MCPVAVANEMSGLRDRVLRKKHSQSRIADAFISNPSPGAGNEDQGSHHTSHEWIDQLGPGGGNSGNVRLDGWSIAGPLERAWYDGLYDRQARRPSPKGVPLAEAGLYRRAFRTDEWQKQALYETDQSANQSRVFGLHLGSSSNRT